MGKQVVVTMEALIGLGRAAAVTKNGAKVVVAGRRVEAGNSFVLKTASKITVN